MYLRLTSCGLHSFNFHLLHYLKSPSFLLTPGNYSFLFVCLLKRNFDENSQLKPSMEWLQAHGKFRQLIPDLFETRLPCMRDTKRKNLHSAYWPNSFYYISSLNFCLEKPADLTPECNSVALPSRQVVNLAFFQIIFLGLFFLIAQHVSIFNLKIYVGSSLCASRIWGWSCPTHLLSFPPGLEVWITSEMLTHIVIMPHKGPQSQGNVDTSNWTRREHQKQFFLGYRKDLSCSGQGQTLPFNPESQMQEATFCVVRNLGSDHQQPYGFGNISQLQNLLIWKNRPFIRQPKIFMWENERLSLCASCWQTFLFDAPGRGFPGGSVVKNLPANAEDTGLIPSPGRSHMPWGN